ncbi:MAG: peptidoglycan editing factor PgeF [cyanobacterium endosymbiont of Rhopalodia musculus]|uniref:peptidoglycan editing factor PgeF n=1 Tax=cyanobacterium endosymbiont of Epithemia clementina EcSB TaxID=3034674 RepID=UPI002480774F|nr:peptidoglycan editing factor PgeF [cyanobacterium endosymbiont of Epithemia clementina EcSB]WGT66958.1 peptidoglycan editing factor PgeF [cyanobacterium endosymbiont of Epithemia clementina EcSB]
MVSSLRGDRQTQTPTWQWQQWDGLPYLTCTLLQDWKHGFLTQQFYPRLPEDLTKVLHPKATTYRVKQVHGRRVLTPREIETQMTTGTLEEPFPSADGLITDDSNQAIWVASADCTPVLVGDIKTHRVAAIHAGWRGTAQRIVPEAIACFQHFGSTLEHLRIAMGPAISGKVYQVSEQVAAEVGSSLFKKEETNSPQEILEALRTMFNSPILPDPKPGRVRLDVRRVNELQLYKLGVRKDQIAIAPHCTYQEPDDFFSYRRTKQKKVQWSGIVCGD